MPSLQKPVAKAEILPTPIPVNGKPAFISIEDDCTK
jgi:hypothetical protein